MSVVANTISIHVPQKSALVRIVEKYFYQVMALLIAAIVTYGFSRPAFWARIAWAIAN